ncbi:MAG: hypothetical protein AAFU56_02420 [Pseudomonadota bacterium]
MSTTKTTLVMPAERDFGWALKPVSSSYFEIHEKDNGQFCVVLNHALLRGVSAEMIAWWFLNFAKMKVRLRDVPGYEEQEVPGYWLWHPVDHLGAELSGALGPDGVAKTGCSIHIREAMQYDRYGWKYPVDTKLKVFYVGPDGWAMGKSLPVIGPVMMLRINFKDVFEEGQHIGAQYHYEVVIGATGNNAIARAINSRITADYGPEFFAAWQRHNVIEVGTFENFLPALYAQRGSASTLEYAREMNPDLPSPDTQDGFDKALFQKRVAGYKKSPYPHAFQRYSRKSFL